MATQPPDDILQPFLELAQAIIEAAANRDYATLGRLIGENLHPELVDLMVYVRSPLGFLTITGQFIDLWQLDLGRHEPPGGLSRVPTPEQVALVLRGAQR